MKAWKVVFCQGQKMWSYLKRSAFPSAYIQSLHREYRFDEWTDAPNSLSPLFAFRTRKQARQFVKSEGQRSNSDVKIFRCEVDPIPSHYIVSASLRWLASSYDGVVLASRIRLLRPQPPVKKAWKALYQVDGKMFSFGYGLDVAIGLPTDHPRNLAYNSTGWTEAPSPEAPLMVFETRAHARNFLANELKALSRLGRQVKRGSLVIYRCEVQPASTYIWGDDKGIGFPAGTQFASQVKLLTRA